MSVNYAMMVFEFMKKHRQLVSRYPHLATPEVAEFRINLIEEELNELKEAVSAGDIYLIADGLADILYVTFGMAFVYGIPIDTIFESVHTSNMSKGVIIGRGDAVKVVKSSAYRPPKIKLFIDQAIRLGQDEITDEEADTTLPDPPSQETEPTTE